LHSSRINSGVSHKHTVTENNQDHQNDHHIKKLNEKRASIPDKSTIVENIHTVHDTTEDIIKKKVDHSTKESTSPGKSNI
jgi:hypothetical protein